jgi:hypothetical protein
LRQARIAAGNCQHAGKRRGGRNAADIRRRQHVVERLLLLVRADEIFAAVRRGGDLELMRQAEIRTRRAVRLDDLLGQQVRHLLVRVLRHIGGEQMIEAAVFADDDDDVLDRRRRLDGVDRLVGIGGLHGIRKPDGRERRDRRADEQPPTRPDE